MVSERNAHRWTLRLAPVALSWLSAAGLAMPITGLEVTDTGVRIEWDSNEANHYTVFYRGDLLATTTAWQPCAGPYPGDGAPISWTDEGGGDRPSPLDPGVARRFYVVEANSDALTTWPNPISNANSDEWIVEHHDLIRQMEPRILVLNFSNDTTMTQVTTLAKQLASALEESSRWLGYDNPSAPMFLDYKLDKLVDLRDDPPVPSCDGNSTKFPRKPNWTGGNNFVYAELYTETFAAYYGYVDPVDPGRYLTLAELVDRGIIHELWFFANHGSCGAPYETIELKQYYDPDFNKRTGGLWSGYGPAGNGHDFGMPWIGRSFRITFLNAHRGIGCGMENFGHALEGMHNYDAIPYYTKYFKEFGGFDLRTRWGLPFTSFYAYGGSDSNSWTDPLTLVAHYRGDDITVPNYIPIGGNVHFTPNGRSHYDLTSPYTATSTIQHWRQGDGPGGEDMPEPFSIADFQIYNSKAPDCMGPWLVYWRQSMPGLDNAALDDDGLPMKNWWPFLFY